MNAKWFTKERVEHKMHYADQSLYYYFYLILWHSYVYVYRYIIGKYIHIHNSSVLNYIATHIIIIKYITYVTYKSLFAYYEQNYRNDYAHIRELTVLQ